MSLLFNTLSRFVTAFLPRCKCLLIAWLKKVLQVLVYIMLKPSMQDFKHDLTSKGDECNCPMVSTFSGTALLGDWDEDWPFPVLWPLLGLPDLLT